MKKLTLLLAVCTVCLAGCSANDTKDTNEPKALGSDRDAHGCIPSAGYSWCARTAQCERPWELAEQKGFENSAEGFKGYCDK